GASSSVESVAHSCTNPPSLRKSVIERPGSSVARAARRADCVVTDFTGISAPYEAPDSAELVLDTASASIDHCLETLVEYVTTRFRLDSRSD
ncbi:MAG: adenylyl-sulfate kinase, partial [Alphaproteobacteria bacterium]